MEVWSQKKMWMVMAMVTLSLIGKISSLSVTVNEVECVYEYVLYEGDTVSGNFVVVDNDIFWSSDHPGVDFTVTSPAGNVVQTLKGVSREKFDFKAPRSGMYKFCFHNPYSTPETVSFYIHVGHIPNEHDLAKDEHLDPVNVKIAELREALESVTAEQKYLKARDSRHRHKSGIVQASTLRVLIEESNDTEKAKEVANSTSYKALSPSGPDPSPDYTNMSDTNLANSTSYNSLGALSPSGADPYHDCINRSNTTGATCGNT